VVPPPLRESIISSQISRAATAEFAGVSARPSGEGSKPLDPGPVCLYALFLPVPNQKSRVGPGLIKEVNEP
jgi:hypothetical protein